MGIAKEGEFRPAISRRDFGKLALTGLGLLAAEVTGLGIVINRKSQSSPWRESSERRPQEVAFYSSEHIRLIEDIEKKLNVVMPLPNTFRVTNIFELNSRLLNQAWSLDEIRALHETSNKLPSAFSLKEKSLLGIVRGNYSGFGGLSVHSRIPRISGLGLPSSIVLFGPNNWDPQQASSETGIWPSLKEEFQAVFVHELTHKLTVTDREIIYRYAEVSGWKERGGKWVYQGDESLVRELMEKRGHPNYKGPEEDIATATMLYATVPDFWQRSWNTADVNRFKFLENTFFRVNHSLPDNH